MQYFAQFYHMSTGYVPGTIPPQFAEAEKKPIEVCGSDSVLPLDGRFSMRTMAQVATVNCRKRGFIGFTIYKGESFTHFQEIRKYQAVMPSVE